MDTEYCKNVYDKLSSAYMSTPFMAYNTMTASALSSADSVDSKTVAFASYIVNAADNLKRASLDASNKMVSRFVVDFASFSKTYPNLTSVSTCLGAAAITASLTNAVGAGVALLGFGSPGIVSGSIAASAMSAAWTSGIGTGAVAAAQSAGALFMNAVGGSAVAAVASVAAPVAVGAAVGFGLYKWLKSEK